MLSSNMLESLDAVEDELKAGRLSFSVNRVYYSCFHIVSAFLLQVEDGYGKKELSDDRCGRDG